jgi:SAM-dependent methyltransferase
MRDEAAAYGNAWAEVYDEITGDLPGRDECVTFLARLAGNGPALELAIGTGRIALPLRERGVEVHGIEASEAMVTRLRAKPGGRDIPVTIGDMADVAVEGTYPLIYLVANSIFFLLTQEKQIRCFANAAQHLAPGGAFVIEAFVLDIARYDHLGQWVGVAAVENNGLRLNAALLDVATQRIRSQHVLLTEQGVRLLPNELRYAWPAELDLMSRLAGLRLRGRWADWMQEPFTSASGRHVSVYVKE